MALNQLIVKVFLNWNRKNKLQKVKPELRFTKIGLAVRWTPIRKFGKQTNLTADKQVCKQKQRVYHFQSGRLSVFLSPHCYAVEPHFWGKRYKSLTFDIFVSVSRLNQGFFALYCVTLLWQFILLFARNEIHVSFRLPVLDYPILDFPTSGNPTSENPTQLNKDI